MRAARVWLAVCALAFAGVVTLGVTGPDTTGVHRVTATSSLPVTTSMLVCPFTGGTPPAPAVTTIASVGGLLHPALTGRTTIETRMLGTRRGRPTSLPDRLVTRQTRAAAAGVTVVTATGGRAAGVAADQRRLVPSGVGRALISTACLPPATDSWIVGADGRVGFDDQILLANPGSSNADLTVTAWSAKGRLDPPKLRSYSVAAHDAAAVPVGDVAPDEAWVTLHVHANSGRVVVAVRDHRINGVAPGGADWIAPTQPPGTDLVVPGFAGGKGNRRLYLTNPGGTDATVSLRLSLESGNFAPAGHATVLVRAGRSSTVDLTEAFGGAPGAVLVRSDHPVAAAGLVQLDSGKPAPEIQWQPASPALTGPAVFADNTPPFNQIARIFVTAPGAATSVRIVASDGTGLTVKVPSGRTVTVHPVAELGAVAHGPLLIIPTGSAPVHAARTLFAAGAHGPLVTSELPSVLPGSVELPAVRQDPRAATP